MKKTHQITLINYPGAQLSALLGLADLFEIANRISTTHNGLTAAITLRQITNLPDTAPGTGPDTILVPPNITGARGTDDTALHIWLRKQHTAGARLASVCAGAFWLGHAGLLDGRPVTTHWAIEDEFRTTFPRAHLHPEHILIDDHDIVTAGGLMAWTDLGLFLVADIMGPQIMTLTARHLLLDPTGREQRNYRSFRPNLSHGDGAILALQHHINAAPDADHTINALANHAALSPRSLQRRFKSATGLPPNAYVQALRVDKARGMLERSRDPVSSIAYGVGYHDVTAFSRVFQVQTGLAPSDYRRRFSVLHRPRPTEMLDRA